MELKEAIYKRRSVREFTTEPVDQEMLRDLIDAAVQARAQSISSPGHSASCETGLCSREYRSKQRPICLESRR